MTQDFESQGICLLFFFRAFGQPHLIDSIGLAVTQEVLRSLSRCLASWAQLEIIMVDVKDDYL